MNIMRNVTEGISPGEMMIFSGGRQTGKSLYYTALKSRIHDTNLCKEIMFPSPPESKYKFSRAKWYTVKLNSDSVWRLSDEYNQAIAWCTEQFGAHPVKQDAWSRWYVGLGYINFRDAIDYEWYMLRWGT